MQSDVHNINLYQCCIEISEWVITSIICLNLRSEIESFEPKIEVTNHVDL